MRFVLAALVCLTLLAVSAQNVAANCGGSDCLVGAFGTAGDHSANVQGFHAEGEEGGLSFTNSGNFDAGRLVLSGDAEGSLSGTFRAGIARGRTTGLFGECTGLCELDLP